MDTVVVVLHVLVAVFVVGPMAILPMTAMRAVRAGEAGQVTTLAKSTNLYALISLLVVVTGVIAVALSPAEYHTTIVTPWVLWSLILTIVAIGLTIGLVVPTMRNAAAALASGAPASDARYPAIAAGSGVASLLLVVVTVLMVWKP